MRHDDFVTLTTADTPGEALVIESALRSAGIAAFIPREQANNVWGWLAPVGCVSGCEVRVMADRLPEAIAVLEKARAAGAAAD